MWSDAEEDIKEISFKDSVCDEGSASFIYTLVNLMYSSLKGEGSPNLSNKTQSVKGWYQTIRWKEIIE